jgi:flagella basal body P-ring formation protein FlgA
MMSRAAPFIRRIAAGLILSIVALSVNVAHGADKAPILRGEVVVAGGVVTIGDLFDNAGEHSDKPIFRSPDLGTTASVAAWRVVAEARSAGLLSARAGSIVDVVVTHAAKEVSSDELVRIIAADIAGQIPGVDPSDLLVTFDQAIDTRFADRKSATPVRIVGSTMLAGNGRFETMIAIDKGGSDERLRIRGVFTETMRVLILVRPIARGEIVKAEDLSQERMPKRQAGAVRAVEPDDLIGLAARRPLRPGQPLAAADFGRPILVNRGETVTMTYEGPGLVLTARGLALEQGARGVPITVMNQQSKRVVQAVISGPGRVTIQSNVTSIASLQKDKP